MRSDPPLEFGETVLLYRAVSPAELHDILVTNSYRVPEGLEGKYFYEAIEQARRFPTLLGIKGYTLTSAAFSRQALESADRIELAVEGPALRLPAEIFPLGPVTVHELIE